MILTSRVDFTFDVYNTFFTDEETESFNAYFSN